MKKIKFPVLEQEILDTIAEKEEFLWDMNPKTVKKHENALKNLMWRELIKRKPTYGNIFVATEMGHAVIGWNEAAAEL